MKTTKILAVTNQKGGVGKTTTSVSLAATLAEKDYDVLLMDLDPQANATVACGIDHRQIKGGAMQLMAGEASLEDVAIYSDDAAFWILPANNDLIASHEILANHPQKHGVLKHHTSDWLGQFQWVIIDCPPTLNLLTINALVLSEYVLVPIQCEYFALEGVSALLDTVGQIQQSVNPDLKIAGFIRTMFDSRSRLTKDVSDNLIAHLKDSVFQTVIPRNVRLAEAPSYGMPITVYDPRSKGARAYRDVAEELLKRLGV